VHRLVGFSQGFSRSLGPYCAEGTLVYPLEFKLCGEEKSGNPAKLSNQRMVSEHGQWLCHELE